MDNFHNTQETLDTLAADTGGKALLDSNDLTLGMTQVQKDINSYYMLTYASTNAAEDGKYRRIQVKLAPKLADLKAKLDYRQGYYAPTTFAKMTGTNKEAQLQEALRERQPGDRSADRGGRWITSAWRKSKYFVPISVRIPGSALSFRNKGAKAATEMDFIGEILDAKGRAGFGGARHDPPEGGFDHRRRRRAQADPIRHRVYAGAGQVQLEVRGARERRG